ncbi:MAG: NAD(P)/FAD-dependent oxidoreductase [Solirubrobacterales bacterium]
MSKSHYDTIVVGGGPGGTTTAALLAEHGHRVLLLERESAPRYHIGESLIPYTWFTLNRLGVVDWLKKSACPKKYSVQFVSITGRVSQPFYFFQTIKHECSMTWQVWRSEFDAMLLDNARKKGAEVRQGVAVTEVIMDGNRAVGVRAEVPGSGRQEIYAKAVVDATGRDSMLSRRFGWKERDEDLNKIAVWSYFKGAKRDPGLDEGATTVAYVPEKGWFWYIPLHSDIVSVGVVGEPSYIYRDTRDADAIFAREAKACVWIHDHIKVGKQVEPVRTTGEYSYHSRKIGGDGFCLVGDAFAFLDPLFSTGVFLALKSGEMAADTLHEGLLAGDVSAARFDAYYAKQRHAVMSFRRLVRAFYNLTFSFREFLQEYPHLHSLVVDTLVGNVFNDLTPLFTALEEYEARPERELIGEATA